MNTNPPADVDRTPYCTKIRYGITGAPVLTEDEMDGSHAPGVGVRPTLIELVYSPARDGKPASVSASVTGEWMRFGQRDGGEVTTHFKNGPDGWPAWLAKEARLHDPAAPVSSPLEQSLRDRIAEVLREHWLCTVRDEADADGNLPCRCGDWREPGAEVDDENDWDAHLADTVLAVLRAASLRELELLARPNTPPSRPEPRGVATDPQTDCPVNDMSELYAVQHAITEAGGKLTPDVHKALDALREAWDAGLRRAQAEAPLSPDYEHPACGFHWHGKDGMDIPMRDGQPACPRCELARVEKLLAHRERRCEELRVESKRRGKVKLEYAEKIEQLEKQLDEVRSQLGAEILRAGQAEAELRRLAAEAPQQDDTDLTETDIDRMMAAGIPVQIVTAPPSTRGAEAPQPDTEARCSCGGWFLIHHLHADDHQPAVPVQPAAADTGEEA